MPQLIVFDLFDRGSKVKNKAVLILLGIGKVLYFLFPDEIADPCTVFLINQGLPSEENAVTWHNVKFVEDDDVPRHKLMGADAFEPDVLVVY